MSGIDGWHGVGFPETRMLQLVATCEGLHRRCLPPASGLPKGTIAAVREAAFAATIDANQKQIVSDALGQLGDLSFRMRLAAFVTYCADGQPLTEGAPWAKSVANARNRLPSARREDRVD